MGRLVDADEIVKQFDPDTWQGEMMIAITNGLPTAFDKNSISELLENEKGNEDDYMNPDGKRLVRHWNLCVDNCKEVIQRAIKSQ
jgi:hypothetical protein